MIDSVSDNFSEASQQYVLRSVVPLFAPTNMSTPAPANSGTETEPTGPTEQAPPEAGEEPQNALTETFTDKEWAALKELRVRAIKIRSTCHFRHANS